MKICVFCNKKPINKNNEHALPKWLMEITGSLERPIYLAEGKHYVTPHNMGSFVFPACTECNDKYSVLEGEAKIIAISMIKGKDLCSKDFEIFMDWLDKVRIALSLGFIMKTKNKMAIETQYGVSTRNKADRIIFLERCSFDKPGLLFTGYEDPLFYWFPSFFGLYFNGISIMSASNSGLLSNKTILPSLEKTKDYKGRQYIAELNYNSKKRGEIPFFGSNTITIAEINYPTTLSPQYLSNEQIKILRNDLTGSKILVKKGRHFIEYPENKSSIWKGKKFESKMIMYQRFIKNFTRVRKWVAEESYVPEKWKPLHKKLIMKLQPLTYSIPPRNSSET